MDASELLDGIKLVPVVVIEDVEIAVPLAECLLSAGIGAIEITLRTAAALESMERVAKSVPDLILGAGSVRLPTQFDEIKRAGARFAVCPGSSAKLLAEAARSGIPFVPGAATATEIINLLEHGYTLQKFFPAELSGGVKKMEALSAPIPEVRFFPTGGISEALATDYINSAVVSCICLLYTSPSPRDS